MAKKTDPKDPTAPTDPKPSEVTAELAAAPVVVEVVPDYQAEALAAAGPKRVVLLDKHRRFLTVVEVDDPRSLVRGHGGVSYTHVDEAPDGTWRYEPI